MIDSTSVAKYHDLHGDESSLRLQQAIERLYEVFAGYPPNLEGCPCCVSEEIVVRRSRERWESKPGCRVNGSPSSVMEARRRKSGVITQLCPDCLPDSLMRPLGCVRLERSLWECLFEVSKEMDHCWQDARFATCQEQKSCDGTLDSRLRGNDKTEEIFWKSSCPRKRKSIITTCFIYPQGKFFFDTREHTGRSTHY